MRIWWPSEIGGLRLGFHLHNTGCMSRTEAKNKKYIMGTWILCSICIIFVFLTSLLLSFLLLVYVPIYFMVFDLSKFIEIGSVCHMRPLDSQLPTPKWLSSNFKWRQKTFFLPECSDQNYETSSIPPNGILTSEPSSTFLINWLKAIKRLPVLA
jgi:hypothetical protein